MEGPTPVLALIQRRDHGHSGVYLIARFHTRLRAGAHRADITAALAAATLFFRRHCALVVTDLKRSSPTRPMSDAAT